MASDSSFSIKFKFDGSAAGLITASLAAKKALANVDSTGRDFSNKFSKFYADTAKGAVGIANQMSNIATAMQVIPALLAVASQAAGAFLLLPGIIAVAGFALTTFKLGADGIKKAFTGVFDPLKKAVSDTFDKKLQPAVKNLKSIAKSLTPDFKGIATAISGMIDKATGVVRSTQGMKDLHTITGATKTTVTNLGAAVGPLVQAFLTLAATAAPIFAQLTKGAGGLAKQFSDFITSAAKSGKIKDWIKGGLDIFKQLFSVLQEVSGIVSDVFSALSDGAKGSISPLAQVISTIHQNTSSLAGQQALKALGDALRVVGGVVSGVLMDALKAVAPLLPPLLTAFASLATTVGSILQPAIRWLAPTLLDIANFIAQNIGWIKPLVIALGVWTAAQWALNIALDANPIGLVIIAIAALIGLVAVVISHWTPIGKFFTDLGHSIANIWNSLILGIEQMWQNGVSKVKTAISDIGTFFSAVGKSISMKATDIVNGVKTAWNNAISAIRGFFSGLGSFVSGIWSGIGRGLKSALNALIGIANGAIRGVNAVTGVIGIPAIPQIPMLAKGGTAQGNSPYVVGEKGPELFWPGQTGRVTSNELSFGGAQTINLQVDLSEGVSQAFQIKIDKHDSATVRKAKAGVGGRR